MVQFLEVVDLLLKSSYKNRYLGRNPLLDFCKTAEGFFKFPKKIAVFESILTLYSKGGDVSRKLRLLVSFALSCIVLLCFYGYGNEIKKEQETLRKETMSKYGGEVISVVVAKRDLKPGDVIDESNVEYTDWVLDLLPQEACTNIESCFGKVLGMGQVKGLVLTEGHFQPQNNRLEVPKGYVAVSLPVNDKLGLSLDVADKTPVVAYRVQNDRSSLAFTDLLVLQIDRAQKIVVLGVRSKDVPGLLEISAVQGLRLVVPSEELSGIEVENTHKAPDTVKEESKEEADKKQKEVNDGN